MRKYLVLLLVLIISVFYIVPVISSAYERQLEFERQKQLEEIRRQAEEAEKARQQQIRNTVRSIMNRYNCDDEELLEIIMDQQEVMNPVVTAIVIGIESGFRRNARNRYSGCEGLMQIHTVHKLKNPYDARSNIEFGTRYLRELHLRFGSIDLALAGYNAGPGHVVRYGGIPNFRETKNYVKKFNQMYEEVSLYV